MKASNQEKKEKLTFLVLYCLLYHLEKMTTDVFSFPFLPDLSVLSLCIHSDLEKSVEKIQKDLMHNHRFIPIQELEEKSLVLKQLGDTLTELKGEMGLGLRSDKYNKIGKSHLFHG